jgi:uncharacterized protein with FMN-binding domain
MKKLVLSLSVISLFAVYSMSQKRNVLGVIGTQVANNNTVNLPKILPSFEDDSSRTPLAAPVAPTVAPTTSSTPQAQGLYRDGVYTGGVADAFYGNIQVQATIRGGKITDVVFLQYPNDRNRSIDINSQAMPYLKQEAITAQSANVDIVSGATATSQAFIASLGSALSQAR